jgi:hypothetical protein
MIAAALRSRSPRCAAGVRRHRAKAAWAALTAASTSLAPATGIVASTSPVAGFVVSANVPDIGSCQAPP